MEKTDKGLEKLGDLFSQGSKNRGSRPQPPAYAWQDLALQVIKELNIPNFKRSAVFKICKERPRTYIEKCLNDTKELCQTGEKWKYFFKVAGGKAPKENYNSKFITK
ncbi:MAG: hypothetical protein WC349_00025 [Patescibacteria group bacterium]|jgi:hypothetical protein